MASVAVPHSRVIEVHYGNSRIAFIAVRRTSRCSLGTTGGTAVTAVQVPPTSPAFATGDASVDPVAVNGGDTQYEHAETVAALAFGLALSQLEATAALEELLASADWTLFAEARPWVVDLAQHDRLAGDQALRLLDAAMAWSQTGIPVTWPV